MLALEHADGTAAAARLAGGRGWRYYAGWGSEAERARQTQCERPPFLLHLTVVSFALVLHA